MRSVRAAAVLLALVACSDGGSSTSGTLGIPQGLTATIRPEPTGGVSRWIRMGDRYVALGTTGMLYGATPS